MLVEKADPRESAGHVNEVDQVSVCRERRAGEVRRRFLWSAKRALLSDFGMDVLTSKD
jgi:hypothetical protein